MFSPEKSDPGPAMNTLGLLVASSTSCQEGISGMRKASFPARH